MKTFLKNNWFKISILIIAIAIMGISFYWFSLRPTEIRKYCNQWATDKARSLKTDYDHYNDYFKWCLEEQGISN